MRFIDWFAGIGGFRRGMELAGHECVGFCEFDKFATASYVSMHCATEQQREYLATLNLKDRQNEILKEEYKNGEWYADDVRRVNPDDIPDAECWCFGFPCQDISISGHQRGFTGNRSSLFYRIMYLVGQLPEKRKPDVLFIENVKNLLSVNRGWDFARLLVEMDRGGTMRNGKLSTLSTTGCRKIERECSLLDIIETPVREEFFLSKGQLTEFSRRYNATQAEKDTNHSRTGCI